MPRMTTHDAFRSGVDAPVLVTGATGFVGSALVQALCARGASVRALVRDPVRARTQLAAPARADGSHSLTFVHGDLTRPESLAAAVDGVATIFHVGGHVGHHGAAEAYTRVNVEGTAALLSAAAQAGVRRFVHTSTPSVIADGTDHFGVDESHPVPARHRSPYPASKAAAEQLVLGAHGPRLKVVVLRPHLIWGPGASQWVRGFIDRAERGAGVRIGDGANRIGMTYLDDCVAAHLVAADALAADPEVGGTAYFIHSGEPVRLWDWVANLCRACGLAAPSRHVPRGIARLIGSGCDLALRTGAVGRALPVSRYLIDELTTEHYSDITRARTRLGYSPTVSIADGISRVAAWYRATRGALAPRA